MVSPAMISFHVWRATHNLGTIGSAGLNRGWDKGMKPRYYPDFSGDKVIINILEECVADRLLTCEKIQKLL